MRLFYHLQKLSRPGCFFLAYPIVTDDSITEIHQFHQEFDRHHPCYERTTCWRMSHTGEFLLTSRVPADLESCLLMFDTDRGFTNCFEALNPHPIAMFVGTSFKPQHDTANVWQQMVRISSTPEKDFCLSICPFILSLVHKITANSVPKLKKRVKSNRNFGPHK